MSPAQLYWREHVGGTSEPPSGGLTADLMLTGTTDGGPNMCASHWKPGEWEATVRSLNGEDSHPGSAGAEEEPRLCSTTAQTV